MCNRSYWSTKWQFYNERFSVIMSGRFELLMKFFHVNDAEKQPNRTSHDCDNIYKIRPFLDLVVKVFQSVYVPNHKLSADESIICLKAGFHGFSICLKKHKMGYQSMAVS